MQHYGRMSEQFPRPLSERERAVLDALLSVDFTGVDALRQQARDVSVLGKCECGCPTVHFSTDERRNRLVADADTAPYAGQSVLLFVTDDGLDSLEVAWTTDQPPVEFPAAEDLIVRAR
jgi:hypothetical protein